MSLATPFLWNEVDGVRDRLSLGENRIVICRPRSEMRSWLELNISISCVANIKLLKS